MGYTIGYTMGYTNRLYNGQVIYILSPELLATLLI